MISVHRHPESPASLAKKKSYNGQDVRDQLQEDFFSKCYLCEREVGAEFQVEHFRPKSGYPELKFEWSNLFPACSCNQRRLRWTEQSEVDQQGNPTHFPRGGMLDPAQDNIEARLDQWIEFSATSTKISFMATRSDDPAAANTAKELESIHNSGETGHVKNLRNDIQSYAAYILDRISVYLAEREKPSSRKARELKLQIQGLTHRKAAFAGLIRGYLVRKFDKSILEELGIVF